MSLKKMEKITRKFFEKEMPSLTGNKYELTDDKLKITNSELSLKGHDDDIYLEIHVTETKGDIPYQALISFTFDQLDPTLENFELINKFNMSVPFFTATITDKNYFRVQWHFSVFDPGEFVLCLQKAIILLASMDDEDDVLKAITARTK